MAFPGCFSGVVKMMTATQGVITTDDGMDLIVYAKSCTDGKTLQKGDKVQFDVEDSPTNPGEFFAGNVSGGSGSPGGKGGGWGAGASAGGAVLFLTVLFLARHEKSRAYLCAQTDPRVILYMENKGLKPCDKDMWLGVAAVVAVVAVGVMAAKLADAMSKSPLVGPCEVGPAGEEPAVGPAVGPAVAWQATWASGLWSLVKMPFQFKIQAWHMVAGAIACRLIPPECVASLCAQTPRMIVMIPQLGDVYHTMCVEDVKLNAALKIMQQLSPGTNSEKLKNQSESMSFLARELVMQAPWTIKKQPMWRELRDKLTEGADQAQLLGAKVLIESKKEIQLLHAFATMFYDAYVSSNITMLEEAKQQLESNMQEFESDMNEIKNRLDEVEVAFIMVQRQGDRLQDEARRDLGQHEKFLQTWKEWLKGDKDSWQMRMAIIDQKFQLGLCFSDGLIGMKGDISARQVMYTQFLAAVKDFVEGVQRREATWANAPKFVISIKHFGIELATFAWNANTANKYWNDI